VSLPSTICAIVLSVQSCWNGEKTHLNGEDLPDESLPLIPAKAFEVGNVASGGMLELDERIRELGGKGAGGKVSGRTRRWGGRKSENELRRWRRKRGG
jgi:hypothetical protein